MSDQQHKEEKGGRASGHGHGGGGHHGGGDHEEGHEGAPEWLISFADNVTLMMGFFVIMLALNMSKPGGPTSNDKKQQGEQSGGPSVAMLDAALAIRAAFNNPVDINSQNPAELPLVLRMIEKSREGYTLDRGVSGKKHEVQSLRPSSFRRPAGAVHFAAHSADLASAAREEAAAIARHFRGIRTIIELRGHASAAESRASEDAGMRLSFERSLAVAKALVADGLDWRQLRILACKDNDRANPLAYDQPGQDQNQRVEALLTDEFMRVYSPEELSGDAEGEQKDAAPKNPVEPGGHGG